MLLTYSEMLCLKREVECELIGLPLEKIEKTGEKTWLFLFGSRGGFKRLLVCANSPFSRFHLSTASLGGSTEAKATDFLKGHLLKGVELVGEDRILGLNFGEIRFVAELMYKRPAVLLTDLKGNVLLSLHGQAPKHYSPPKREKAHLQEEVKCTSAEIEKRYRELLEGADIHALQSALLNALKKELKKVEARLDLHRKELEEAKCWREFEHVAQMLQSNFPLLKRGMDSIELEDWEQGGEKRRIPLNPALSPEKIVKQHFKEVRKLKKRLEISGHLIDGLEKKRAELAEALKAVGEAKEKEILERWQSIYLPTEQKGGAIAKKQSPAHPFREFRTLAGFEIFVGKKDQDNDRLSLSFARGNDLWFHAANAAGSHVVLRIEKGQIPDEESIQDAMELALHFSKVKNASAEEVTLTECKYVSKPKGARPGQVNLSKHKTRYWRRDPKRLKRLLG